MSFSLYSRIKLPNLLYYLQSKKFLVPNHLQYWYYFAFQKLSFPITLGSYQIKAWKTILINKLIIDFKIKKTALRTWISWHFWIDLPGRKQTKKSFESRERSLFTQYMFSASVSVGELLKEQDLGLLFFEISTKWNSKSVKLGFSFSYI